MSTVLALDIKCFWMRLWGNESSLDSLVRSPSVIKTYQRKLEPAVIKLLAPKDRPKNWWRWSASRCLADNWCMNSTCTFRSLMGSCGSYACTRHQAQAKLLQQRFLSHSSWTYVSHHQPATLFGALRWCFSRFQWVRTSRSAGSSAMLTSIELHCKIESWDGQDVKKDEVVKFVVLTR